MSVTTKDALGQMFYENPDVAEYWIKTFNQGMSLSLIFKIINSKLDETEKLSQISDIVEKHIDDTLYERTIENMEKYFTPKIDLKITRKEEKDERKPESL